MVVLETVTTDVKPRVGQRKRRSNQGSYRYRLIVVDLWAASTSAAAIYIGHTDGLAVARQPSVTRNVVTVIMPLVWLLTVGLHRGYDRWWVIGPARMRRRIVQ